MCSLRFFIRPCWDPPDSRLQVEFLPARARDLARPRHAQDRCASGGVARKRGVGSARFPGVEDDSLSLSIS
jgi:hypothetical protein